VGDRPDIARSADLLVALLGHAIKAARFATRDLTDDDYFWEPVTPCWGIRRRVTPTSRPLWQLLWTSIVDHFHHSAEIGALRDLRRGHANHDWWPELQGPDWWPL
jgi:hypothetical protein